MTATTTGSSLEHAIGVDGLFSIRLRDGKARLRAVDGDTIRVREVHGRDLSGMFAIGLADGNASLWANRGLGLVGILGSGHSPDLEIELPPGATVVVETASAEIDVDGLLGDQRYRTASGDMTLRAVSGRIAVEAISGDVDVVAFGEADVAVRTVSGDVALRAGTLRSLRATTTSGDLKVAGRLAGPGPFGVETVSGDALLALAGDVTIEMTTMSGDLRSEVEGRQMGGRGHRSLSIGTGGPLLAVRSMSGDLRVVRATPVGTAAEPRTLTPDAPGVEPATSTTNPTIVETADDAARLNVLRSLERGEIDVVEAGRRLQALDGGEPVDHGSDTERVPIADPTDV